MTEKTRPGAMTARSPGEHVAGPRGDVGLAEARQRFGGLDVPASLAGTHDAAAPDNRGNPRAVRATDDRSPAGSGPERQRSAP